MVNPDIQETQQQAALAEKSAAEAPTAEDSATEKTGGATEKKDQVAAQVTAQNGSSQGEMPFALVQGEPLTVVPGLCNLKLRSVG